MTRALEPVHPAPRLGMGRAGQTPGSLSPLAGDLLAPQQMLGSPGHCCQQVEGWGGAPCEVWQSGDKMEFASLSLEPSWHPERRIFFFFFFLFFREENLLMLHFCHPNLADFIFAQITQNIKRRFSECGSSLVELTHYTAVHD